MSGESAIAAAERLLGEARAARWTFPTSSGRPVLPEVPAWAERLVTQRAGLGAAASSFVRAGDSERALELMAHSWRVWVLAHDEAAGREVLAAVLGAAGETPPTQLAEDAFASPVRGGASSPSSGGDTRSGRFRALALYGDSLLAFRLGALADSRAQSQAALELARRVSDREAEGLAHLGLSRVALSDGEASGVRSHAAAARAAFRELGASYQPSAVHMLAQAARLGGSYDDAAALFAESLELNRALGDRGMVVVEFHNLGHVELRRGRVDAADRCFAEADALAGATEDPYDLALRGFNAAAIAHARGDSPRAKALLAEAHAILARDGTVLAVDDQRELEWLERQLGP
jgi:tetratricopeptide (TPR) repeat protein